MKTYYLIVALALFCVAADEAAAPVSEIVSETETASEIVSEADPESQVIESAAVEPVSTAPAAEISTPETVTETPQAVDVNAELAEAKSLEDQKEYQKAREAYSALLQNPELDIRQKKEATRAFEAFTMRRLLSKEESDHSEFYTVVAGDNLTKIAKQFKTNIDLIKKVNELKNDTIFAGKKLKIVKGSFKISVDKSDNELTLYLNGNPLKHYDVSTGSDNSTPAGEFKIVNKVENPTWYKEKKTIPAGSPENELGSRWLGFDKAGYGIHGTIDPASIGSQMSSGCVRMHNADVEEIYSIVPHGTVVTITD